MNTVSKAHADYTVIRMAEQGIIDDDASVVWSLIAKAVEEHRNTVLEGIVNTLRDKNTEDLKSYIHII